MDYRYSDADIAHKALKAEGGWGVVIAPGPLGAAAAACSPGSARTPAARDPSRAASRPPQARPPPRAPPANTSRPPRLTAPAHVPWPARSRCSLTARSAASSSTWTPSRSASTPLPGQRVPRLRGRPSDQSPAAGSPRHDGERLSTIVNSSPRGPPNGSRSPGTLFTFRGIAVHHHVDAVFMIAWNAHPHRSVPW